MSSGRSVFRTGGTRSIPVLSSTHIPSSIAAPRPPAADAGERPAVALELVEGESLSALLERDGPLDPRTAVEIGAEVAEALYHAHTRGVIHRDVKPGNVLIGTDGHPRLVDFGIARLLGEALERTTQTGVVMGTLRCMAPEQLAAQEAGPRVDLD